MIRTCNLEFHYDSNNDIFNDNVLKEINIEIKEGEFVAILGHNGCGKSTLAKHFNAILVPSEGKVYVNEMDTSDDKLLFDIRQSVGMVFQNPDNQIVATIVEEDVAFAPENLGVPPEEIRRRVDWALKSVGMYEFRKHAPHNLSGGQKQRISIAGVLAMSPKYIVLDEPTAMLDPFGRQEVMKTIRTLNKEFNMTVVLITHYMDEAAKADRVVVMNNGDIIIDDAPKKVFSNVSDMKSIGLDVPQVTELAYELIKAGISIKNDILEVDECVEELLKLL